MKKLLLIVLFIIPFKVSALSTYIVLDASSNRVLEGSNIHDQRLIASTTKIMTCIIALENSDIKKVVKVDKDVLKAYGSSIYIEVGEELTIEDLLYGLMLRSGNDAAIIIANNVFNSMDEFVKKMNEKAIGLGMKDTIFINNHGLEDESGNGNKSSAYDMAILMSYAIKNDKFREIISTKEKIVKSSYKTYTWNNKNKLLNDYKYLIGGKTGYTKKAKRTLVTAATKDNKTIVVVTLNDPNDFNDHKSLYEKNFKKYNLVTILNKEFFTLKDIKYNGTPYIKEDYKMLLTKEEEDKISLDYNMFQDINYNNDDKIGEVKVKLNNEVISKVDVFIKTKKEKETKKSWFKKLIDFLIFWK